MPDPESLVRVLDLKKSYGDLTAVKGVSFEILRGEIFGLLGPNGAGKTTTISIIAGLSPPTSGAVEIDGKKSQEGGVATRKKVGLVPQELAIYPKLTAFENLEFFGALYGLKGPTLATRIAEMLTLVGLSDRV